MTDKPEYVDLISDATKQMRRRATQIVDLQTIPTKDTSRLGKWPPEHWQQWRMEKLTPWKIKPWES